MKVYRITLLSITLLFLITGCNRGYDSLEEAVQSQWETPIEVVNQDVENKLVYYVDQTQYILDMYYFENGKYRYDSVQRGGTGFETEAGLPFLTLVNHFEGIGNIIHGAIRTDKQKVEKFVIKYKNGESEGIKAKNNTFITEFPSTIKSENPFFEIDNVIGYDEQGKIVESLN